MSFLWLDSSFLFSVEQFSIVWMDSLFIDSPVEEHLGCFQVLAIMNKAAIYILVRIFVCIYSSTPLGKDQGA